MKKEEALAFISKFRAGQFTAAEHTAFLDWLRSQSPEEQEALVAEYTVIFETAGQPAPPPEMPWQRIEARITPAQRRRWPVYAAAAAVLGVLVTAALWYMKPVPQMPVPSAELAARAILPAGDKAILTLGDGSSITLDNAANGRLAQQGQTNILKPSAGQLQYDQQGVGEAVQMNTLATPRGGQYQITLPDGSKVWLNAASSLRFPTAFTGAERLVYVEGEAYFEVAPNEKRPFRVTTGNDLSITVLGTHFNVMAYADEAALKTTLLEGSVRLSGNGGSRLLRPGQEGRLNKESGALTVAAVDVEEAVAWKNGIFQFENADIAAITRQLARWYDVDVVINGPLPHKNFVGVMSRREPLASVLKVLASTGVQFRVEGRKLIVTP